MPCTAGALKRLGQGQQGGVRQCTDSRVVVAEPAARDYEKDGLGVMEAISYGRLVGVTGRDAIA
jgi:hypothetical protein